MATQAQKNFIIALQNWIEAGHELTGLWRQEIGGYDAFDADVDAPLPDDLAPPKSLDEWFPELEGHYLSAFHICIGCGEDLHEADGETNMCLNPKCEYFHDMSGRGMGLPVFDVADPHGGGDVGEHVHHDNAGGLRHTHVYGLHGSFVNRELSS